MIIDKFRKCINKDTLETYYNCLTQIDKLYIESLEERRHVKHYKLFKNCVLLFYVSGSTFKQFLQPKSIENILNKDGDLK